MSSRWVLSCDGNFKNWWDYWCRHRHRPDVLAAAKVVGAGRGLIGAEGWRKVDRCPRWRNKRLSAPRTETLFGSMKRLQRKRAEKGADVEHSKEKCLCGILSSALRKRKSAGERVERMWEYSWFLVPSIFLIKDMEFAPVGGDLQSLDSSRIFITHQFLMSPVTRRNYILG